MKYLMAIDAGTGSIRAVIFDEYGNQISVSQKEWTHLSEENVPNSMSFDFETNWQLVIECIKESIEKSSLNPNQIVALSATSMREGIVLYDEQGKELWGVANVDARASQEVKYLKENFEGIEEEFYEKSGQTFALGALPRIMWLKNNRPEIYAKVASEETTLDMNTKVVTGGGDVQLGSAGLGVVEHGQVAILGGSFWQQIVNIDSNVKPPKDMSIRVNPHVITGQSQAEGITFFSGLIMRWFRDAFCDLEKLEAKEKDVDVYEILEEKAKEVPIGSNGIIPIFSDSMKYGKWYHAAPSFINLSIDSQLCNKASMFRSLQENACIVSNINLEKIKEFTNLDFKEIVFAGGASKGKLWPQILSDVTGCKIKIPKVTEATALGAAMSAGVGAGIFESLSSAAKTLVVWDKEYLPNEENTKEYKKIQEKWQEVYEKQLKLVDEGLTTSMWQAPGL
jgi:sugar (pentulose or hexulose) kinase